MKFTAAVLVAAAGAAAHSNVTYVTEVVESYVTYCPAPTTISHGSQTWTVTEPTTLTITDCPCTLTKPVLTTSAVECHDCPKPTTEVYQPPPPATTSAVVVVPSAPASSSAMVVVPSAPATAYPVPPPAQPTAPQMNTTVPVPTPGPVTPPQSGAAKVAGFSGIFGVVAIAAFFL